MTQRQSIPDPWTNRSAPGAFFAKDDGNLFVCQACNARYCMSCNVPFHEEQTCEQYLSTQRRAEEENASIAAIAQISRPCPNCGINIEKYTGCDHVTCKICSTAERGQNGTNIVRRPQMPPRVLLGVFQAV